MSATGKSHSRFAHHKVVAGVDGGHEAERTDERGRAVPAEVSGGPVSTPGSSSALTTVDSRDDVAVEVGSDADVEVSVGVSV
jgi:hypothetical protein